MLIHAIAVTVIAMQPVVDEPEESGGDPYLPMDRITLATPATPSAGEFTSVQTNVIGGMNVLGDAANEPSIAVDPTAPLRIAVGWRQFDNADSSFRQAGYSYSVDGGRTWADVSYIEGGLFRSDPVLTAGADGTMYYLSLTTQPFFFNDVFVSHDAGATWPDKHFAYGGDKAWFTIDPSGGAKLYQSWSTAANNWAPAQFNRSVADDMLWEEPVSYDGGQTHPTRGTLAVGVNGEVYSVGVPGASPSPIVNVLRSDDAQDPFAPSPTFTSTIIEPGDGVFWVRTLAPNPGGLFNQINVAVDRSGGPFHGRVYVLGAWWNFQTSNIVVTHSDDGGVTWSDLVYISDPADDIRYRWFGTLAVAPNGRLDVVYNDNIEASDGEPNLTRTYYSASEDGGQTWSAPTAVGPQWDSHVGWPNQNKIGDYYDMVSDRVGAHLIYSATYNGEQDVYYLRINDNDCNDNGIGDRDRHRRLATQATATSNGIPDECEIAAGTLEDSNGDGIPDQCDCPGDFNGDGVLNVLDFVAFQLAWQVSDPAADCDASGTFDIIDFVCFQTRFQEGCD